MADIGVWNKGNCSLVIWSDDTHFTFVDTVSLQNVRRRRHKVIFCNRRYVWNANYHKYHDSCILSRRGIIFYPVITDRRF